MGWKLGPWGRAREARLTAPDGTNFTPGDILECHTLPANVDFLRLRVRELERNGLDHQQRVAVIAAIQALEQVINARERTLQAQDSKRHCEPDEGRQPAPVSVQMVSRV